MSVSRGANILETEIDWPVKSVTHQSQSLLLFCSFEISKGYRKYQFGVIKKMSLPESKIKTNVKVEGMIGTVPTVTKNPHVQGYLFHI